MWTTQATQNILMGMNMFRKSRWWADTKVNIAIHTWQSKGIFVNTNRKALSHQGLGLRFSVAKVYAQLHSSCEIRELFTVYVRECSGYTDFAKITWQSTEGLWESPPWDRSKIQAPPLPHSQSCFCHRSGPARYSGSSHYKLNHCAAFHIN